MYLNGPIFFTRNNHGMELGTHGIQNIVNTE